MFDVITIGSATRDIFISSNLKQKQEYLCLYLGEKLEIEKPFTETGGGATNTAVAFSRLGLKTAAITKIGKDDSGHLVRHSLERDNVSNKFLLYDGNEGTANSIIFFKGKDRTVFVYRGASQHIKLNEIKFKDLNTSWLYVAALSGQSVKILMPLLKYAKSNGIGTAMNPGAKELEMPYLLKYVDVLLLNKEEAEKLSKTNDIVKCFKVLAKLGPKTIAITDGKNKVNVLHDGFIYSAAPYEVKIENTLGAGDAFCSGFVSALIKKKSVEDAINLGLLNSSSVIQHFGAKVGLLYYKDLASYEKSFRRKIVISRSKF